MLARYMPPAAARVHALHVLIACACALLADAPLRAQQGTTDRRRSVRTIAPGPHYAAGGLHRLFFGDHNRQLWTTPIRVPELDLDTFAGGLEPLERGGGLQTRSLRFQGGDGREYAFRSVDKDPSSVLPPELRQTLVDRLIQDQTSAGHPTAALVVAPLLDAVGVLHSDPHLFVMPDDPRLGEFRAEFAGMLGLMEERPEDPTEEAPGFAGAANVVGTERLLERMEEDGERVDERAFLTARLVDLFLGDWDRHRDQWRWARFEPGPDSLWQPIPRDRDQAFARLDGLLLNLARRSYPQLVDFGEEYPGIVGLTWNGRELDRRFLARLQWQVWDSIARYLQGRLTDEVIAGAVAHLPREHGAVQGESLEHTLRMRRDALHDAALEFYRLLARETDVHMSDLAETLDVNRIDDRFVDITITRRASATPVYKRRFDSAETSEVRIYLYGGGDSVRLRGDGGGSIDLRVIGGGGDDVIRDESRGGASFYDARGELRVVRGPNTHLDRREFVSRTAAPGNPLRDWGTRTLPLSFIGASPDAGVTIGGGLEHFNYGFRKEPFASHTVLRVAYAMGARAFRGDLSTELRRQNSDVRATVSALASGYEILFFHGLGNEAGLTAGPDFYKVRLHLYSLDAQLVLPLSDTSVTLAFGPSVQYSDTRRDDEAFIGLARPYGADAFGQAGVRARFGIDRRDRMRAATRGFQLTAEGSWFPSLWDVEGSFGELHGEATTYLSPGGSSTFALRAGATKVFGTYPFHEAAYIGDASTVRLGRKQRFGGDAALYGTAELRQKLGRIMLVLPGDIGILGFTDAGRVFLEGEDSNRWHTAFGGGLWLAFLRPENTLSLSVARSEERTGFYFQAGFAF